MKIKKRYLAEQFPIDGIADSIINILGEILSEGLVNDIRESLRGFDDDMQLEIADDLLDCANQESIHYTGIKHVDNMLKAFYMLICEETGYPLKKLVEDHQNSIVDDLPC